MFRRLVAFVFLPFAIAAPVVAENVLVSTPRTGAVISSETIETLPVARDASSFIHLVPRYAGTETVEDFNVTGVVGSPEGTWAFGQGNGAVLFVDWEGTQQPFPLAQTDEEIIAAAVRVIGSNPVRYELAFLDAANGVVSFLDRHSRREVTASPNPFVQLSGLAWNARDGHYLAAQTTLGSVLKMDPYQGFSAVIPMPMGWLPLAIEAAGDGFEVTTANGRIAYCAGFMCMPRNPLPNGGVAAGLGCLDHKCYTGDVNGGRYFSWNSMDPPSQTQYQEFSIPEDLWVIRIGSNKKHVFLQLTDEFGHSDKFLIPDVARSRPLWRR